MKSKHSYYLVNSSALIAIYLLAIFIQSTLLLNWDVSWLMHASKEFLQGGKYGNDFFEVNPPMAILLYVPAVLIKNIFHIDSIMSLRIYVYLLSTLSLLMNYWFVRRIFLEKDRLLVSIFIITIACILLILPTTDFGQREHILIILTLPYFLAVTYRTQQHIIHPYYAILIGLMAGFGFAVKPYYLLLPLLIESYYILHIRKWSAWLRPETLSMFILIIFYILFIAIYHNEYITIVAPVALRYYYLGFGSPLIELLNALIYFCFFVLILSFYQKESAYKSLKIILRLSLIGFLLAYIIHGSFWLYHFYPIFSIMILFIVLQFFLLANDSLKTAQDYLFTFVLSILIFSCPLYKIHQNYNYGAAYKKYHMKLISYMKKNMLDKSMYIFSSTINDVFPAIDYTNVNYVSRFAHFFMLPGMAMQTTVPQNNSTQLTQDKNLILNMVAEDLVTKKPDLIFIDVANFKSHFFAIPFDFVQFFMSNDKFRTVWKQYHYLTTIEQYPSVNINSTKFDLYLISDKNNFNPHKITGNAVILTGKDNPRIAYFVIQNQLLKTKWATLSKKVTLSKAQLQTLDMQSQSVPIIRTSSTYNLVNEIIAKAIIDPVYKFDIYQRN